jgi:hypothetical protein
VIDQIVYNAPKLNIIKKKTFDTEFNKLLSTILEVFYICKWQRHNRNISSNLKFEQSQIAFIFLISMNFAMLIFFQCSLVLPSTCGIPSGFARHFSQSWKSTQVDTDSAVSSESTESRTQSCKMEGYVKIPKYV